MFTERELKSINFILSKTSKLLANSFDFNGGELFETASGLRRYSSRMNFVLLLAHTALIISKFSSTLARHKMEDTVFCGVCLFTSGGMAMCEATILLHQQELIALFNQTLSFNRNIGR
jgi:hypothetical protein